LCESSAKNYSRIPFKLQNFKQLREEQVLSIFQNLRTEQGWRDIIKDYQENGQSSRFDSLRSGISERAFHYHHKNLTPRLEPKQNLISRAFVKLNKFPNK